LKFEPDPSTIFRSYGAGAEIGQKGAFFKGLRIRVDPDDNLEIFFFNTID
jgi:hypothetical protein